MTRSTTVLAAGAAALAIAALAAGWGGSSANASSGRASANSSGGYGNAGNSNGSMTKTAAKRATITVASSSLGRILVDGHRRTVYLFEKDKGMRSTCYGACASFWPPVTTSAAPLAGKGASTAKLGTIKRSNGTLQVVYNRHPLYTYAGDAKPGQTNGEGVNKFGAEWYAVSPAGKTVENGGS